VTVVSAFVSDARWPLILSMTLLHPLSDIHNALARNIAIFILLVTFTVYEG